MRRPVPLQHFLDLVDCPSGPNSTLRQMNHPPLIQEDVIAARLYSGPYATAGLEP